MRITLIRHGQVEASQRDRYYGGIEVALSDFGKAQAQAAAATLAGQQVDYLWSSPLSRAQFGAACVRDQAIAPELEVADEVREIDRGRWVGVHKSELLGAFPGDLESHERDPRGWRGHGGESLGDLESRVRAFWDRITALRAEHQVVVSHLFPTRCMVGLALQMPIEKWRGLEVGTGSLSVLRRGEAGWELAELGLQPPVAEFS